MPFPGTEIAFEFKNDANENLLATGALLLEDIHIQAKNSSESQTFFNYEDKAVTSFFHNVELYTLEVGTTSFELEVKIKEVKGDNCCTGFRLESVSINGQLVPSENNTVSIVL
jgi:5,10-methylene-tetrahydrofolate dehydrogenase/methenyl tetrahydrofolate cyclohydrolase